MKKKYELINNHTSWSDNRNGNDKILRGRMINKEYKSKTKIKFAFAFQLDFFSKLWELNWVRIK